MNLRRLGVVAAGLALVMGAAGFAVGTLFGWVGVVVSCVLGGVVGWTVADATFDWVTNGDTKPEARAS